MKKADLELGVYKDEHIFVASWQSYIALMFVPVMFIVMGFFIIFKIKFRITEYLICFIIPSLWIVVDYLFIHYNKLVVCGTKLNITRFIITKLKLESTTIDFADIKYGLLANNYLIKNGIMKRSGLKVVPISVLYLEYVEGGDVKKIAFNVSFYDNSKLILAISKIPQIDVDHYKGAPSI